MSWIGPGAALLVGVYADLAFNLFSAMNSSPQTTELFADDRAETLWKYVKIADAAAVGFGLLGTLLDQGKTEQIAKGLAWLFFIGAAYNAIPPVTRAAARGAKSGTSQAKQTLA